MIPIKSNDRKTHFAVLTSKFSVIKINIVYIHKDEQMHKNEATLCMKKTSSCRLESRNYVSYGEVPISYTRKQK